MSTMDPDAQDIAEMESTESLHRYAEMLIRRTRKRAEEDREIAKRVAAAKEAMAFYWSMKNWECPNCFTVGEVYDSDMKCRMCGAPYPWIQTTKT